MYALLPNKKIKVTYSGALIDVRKMPITQNDTSQEYYDRMLIVDTVRELQKGKIAYCFTMRQVKNVARCVGCVTVWRDDKGNYCLSA